MLTLCLTIVSFILLLTAVVGNDLVFVKQGGKFTIKCRVPLTGVHLWFKDGKPIVPNGINKYHLEQDLPTRGDAGSGSSGMDYYTTMYLTVEHAEPIHTGVYKCNSFSTYSRHIIVVTDNMIETNEPEPGKGIILKTGHQLALQCNATECPLCKIGWSKDGNALNISDSRIHILAENNSLVIDKATEDDTGNYVCAVIRDDMDLIINATIPVLTEVTVEPFHKSHKSMNLVQGDKLILNCNANGRPKPTIKWFKGSNPLNTNESRVKLTSDSSGVENAILTIENLDFGDRDYYTCEADNGISTANATILVRVKDKLAALWPFLGICAEVAILCSIIFIYEKKRGKPDFDESDTDHNQENKNVPDQKGKSQDVRQRK